MQWKGFIALLYFSANGIFINVFICEGAVTTIERDLITKILQNYNKDALPTIDPKGGVNVTFGIRLRNILRVDEKTQVIKTRIWVAQSWRNELMQWNPADWGNITEISLQPDLVWLPDTVLYNAAGDTFPGGTEVYKTKVVASSSGKHSWNSPASFSTSCNINVRYFPFDEQVCFLRFGSWAHDKAKINMYAEPVEWVTIYLTEGSEWKVHSPEVRRNIQVYACCSHPFVDVQFFFTLKRKPMYFILTLIIPCLLMLPLTSVSFYLPPESGERIGLTITILLAVAVFLQVTSQSLPKSSDNIPLIGLFFLAIMAATALSLITTGFVLLVHFKGEAEDSSSMPKWVRKIFLGKLARLLRVKETNSCKSYDRKETKNSIACESGLLEYENIPIKAFKGNNKKMSNSMNDLQDAEIGNSYSENHNDGVNKQNNPTLKTILGHVAYFTTYLKDSERKIYLAQEWKMVAKVIDRLILLAFVIVCITISCGLLYPVFQH